MKLTEKELNEFPIGAKISIHFGIEYIKVKCSGSEWFSYADNYCWQSTKYFLNKDISKVKIPKYDNYIPPKPILDDKEKEYLSYVIRPWRNKVGYIEKRYDNTNEWIEIYMQKGNSYTNLPRFKKSTMYKGMELDREYTLEDLRLIVDEKIHK